MEVSDILDIRPALRRKKQASCGHRSVSVDDAAASLTCDECEADIDPWWYLRQLALHNEKVTEYRRQVEVDCDAKMAECNAKIAKFNETVERLNAEIRQLNETKNRLWNEQIGGRPLGMIVTHPRRRARKAP